MKPIKKSSLSPQRQHLVELMQDISFGRISHIPFRAGEPEISPETVIEREFKLSGNTNPRPVPGKNDFELKNEIITLFAHLDRAAEGTIGKLDIKHGLPFQLLLWERAI